MKISVSLQFPRENCPFLLNFHEKTIGKFRYFLLCNGLEKRNEFVGFSMGHIVFTDTDTIPFFTTID